MRGLRPKKAKERTRKSVQGTFSWSHDIQAAHFGYLPSRADSSTPVASTIHFQVDERTGSLAGSHY